MNNQKKQLLEVYDKLYNIYKYHNKNLTKKQYYDLEESIEKLEKILKEIED